MTFDPAIIEMISHPRFNPPAIVEQLRPLGFAVVTEAMLHEFEAEYVRAQEARSRSLSRLTAMLAGESFKDDGEGFSAIISSFEAQADEVGKKLYALEKAVRRAQKQDPSRNQSYDARLLKIARQDFEDRIDSAVYWRAMQAKIWPTPISERFDDPADLGRSLRAAMR